MNKNFIIILLLIIISFIIPFIIIETFLYMEDYKAKYKSFQYKIGNINYDFNDNPKNYLNDKNEEKIIFLGDSYTQGVACAGIKKDFVNVIKSKMGINCKSSIYNFGSQGKGPSDYLNIYNYLKQKNLRRVIVVLYFNDIQITFSDCLTFRELNKKGYPKIKNCEFILKKKLESHNNTILKKIDKFLEHTKFWIFAKNRLVNIPFLQKHYSRLDFVDLFYNQHSEQFITLMYILKQLQTDAKKNGIIIDFLYFPDVYYLKDEIVSNKAWQYFIDVAKTEGIIINDPMKYFVENKDSDNMSWSLIDFHPNCKAHEIMANYIVEKIL